MSDIEAGVRALLDERLALGGFSGAAVAVAVDGLTVLELEVGTKASVDANGERISADAGEPVTRDTRFDLASVTKLASAHTLLSLVADGALDLDEPVAAKLPAYGTGAKKQVTLRHLLTHTSGLPASWHGWEQPLLQHLDARPAGAPPLEQTPFADREALLADLLATEPVSAPGEHFRYSDAGYNTAMALAETVTGEPWERLVAERALRPLGLGDEIAFGAPAAASVATEFDTRFGRGLLRGSVHDETAWVLGGRGASAGLFGTAAGLLALAEALRAGGGEILSEWMWDGQLGRMLGAGRERDTPSGYDHSLGPRIGQLNMMGRSGWNVRGHTGFTGTSLQTDRDTGISIALLTNRVHPSRHGAGISGLRGMLADAVYVAVGRADAEAMKHPLPPELW
ncbi:serine hydrolase domain-containing protein [Gryllotalpicola protaetiae]|uniref:Class A beta-lactamase-related serine hydrolase n=1 Tax=Gryllotalpicola protaetiae TaxID=2419771 RepID=A0A387BK59_9MICO|nr:serine hydrolase domain-containing protein [Gryllotalpicola protaetiae]AYG03018.1 class A beta-lactamase-related serine hydrolase [Gryllotalpicola protaetiae]